MYVVCYIFLTFATLTIKFNVNNMETTKKKGLVMRFALLSASTLKTRKSAWKKNSMSSKKFIECECRG